MSPNTHARGYNMCSGILGMARDGEEVVDSPKIGGFRVRFTENSGVVGRLGSRYCESQPGSGFGIWVVGQTVRGTDRRRCGTMDGSWVA